MQRTATTIAFLLVLALAQAAFAAQGSEAPQAKPLPVGTSFPDVPLNGTLDADQTAYLGLDGQAGGLRLTQVKAPLVLVEVFSMYCPHCQREAPVMNELYGLIKQRGLDGRLKVVGIGAGNSQAEIDIFRDKYGNPFPLFIDPDLAIHSTVGRVGTPFFYLLRKDAKTGAYTIIFTRFGRMDSAESFLDQLTQAADGLQGAAK